MLSIVNELPVALRAVPPQGDGRGLTGMRQRVELLGGVIDVGPCDPGWSVRVRIPLTDARQCSH
jgi:glucose-6-phosphate-specific signal transduction histidine kinase